MTVTTEALVQAQREKQGPISKVAQKTPSPHFLLFLPSSSHLTQIAVAIRIFLKQEHVKVLATVLRFFSP